MLLIGHSYGGAVTSAAGNDPKVGGLAFVAAYSPEQGEICAELTGRGGATIPDGLFQPDSLGRLRLNADMFHTVFCQDLAADEAQAMTEPPRLFWRLLFVRRSYDERYKEQVFA